MKKLTDKILLILVALPLLFISCSDDNYGSAVITIDPASINDPLDESFFVKGTVVSEPGSTISNISLIALYKVRVYETPWSHNYTIQDKTELIANIGHKEIRRISDNEYEFLLTKENTTLTSYITTMYGIRVNANVKDGERSSITWDIKPEYVFE